MAKTQNTVCLTDDAKRKNALKHVASALIQDILREDTTPEKPCSQSYIVNQLKARYDLDLSRQTVARHLSRMLEEDLNVVRDEHDKYYYDALAYAPFCFAK